MKKAGAALSPVVPGKYFVFLERLVREQYRTLLVEAESEAQASEEALRLFHEGATAYMSCAQVEPPVARVRPVREKHLRKSGAEAPQPDGVDSDFHTSGTFEGAGDGLVQPTGQFPGTRPAPMTRAQARTLCQNFDASGHSNHSGQGASLWVILEHCAARGIAYNLHALPGVGYYVERAKSVEDGRALRMPVQTTYDALPD